VLGVHFVSPSFLSPLSRKSKLIASYNEAALGIPLSAIRSESRSSLESEAETNMTARAILGVMLMILSSSRAHAQDAPEDALQGFLDTMRPHLIEAIPHPLFETSKDWGRQSMTFHALRWNGLKPRVVKTPKNDGTWRKMRVDTRNWPGCLVIKVLDIDQSDPERMTFNIYLSFQGAVEAEQQNWENGIRFYSGSARARFRIHSVLDCENKMTLDTSGPLPELVMRLRVTNAVVKYDDLVLEHVAGFGGTAAKWVGEMIHESINQWKPSLERRILERANTAIVRAADTREVRLGFGKLIGKK